jgi:hypothetical protein
VKKRVMLLLTLVSTASGAQRFDARVTTAAVGGGVDRGGWLVSAYGGWPWFGARGQWGAADRLALQVGVDSALATRWRPYAGVSVALVRAEHFRLSGEASFGWLLQTGVFARRGPSAEVRLRLAVPLGRVAPYVSLATQYTALFDRTTVETAGGDRSSLSLRQELTFMGTAGIAVAVSRHFGFEVGVGLPWVDAPNSLSLPLVFVGLHGGSAP